MCVCVCVHMWKVEKRQVVSGVAAAVGQEDKKDT